MQPASFWTEVAGTGILSRDPYRERGRQFISIRNFQELVNVFIRSSEESGNPRAQSLGHGSQGHVLDAHPGSGGIGYSRSMVNQDQTGIGKGIFLSLRSFFRFRRYWFTPGFVSPVQYILSLADLFHKFGIIYDDKLPALPICRRRSSSARSFPSPNSRISASQRNGSHNHPTDNRLACLVKTLLKSQGSLTRWSTRFAVST